MDDSQKHIGSSGTRILDTVRGFTMIELVVVIILLGIMAAAALPRFLEVGSQARIAKLESLEGSMLTAASMANAQSILENKTDCSDDPTIQMENQTITLRCGYPCPHPSGIARAVNTGQGFSWSGGNCSGVLGAINVRVSDAPDPPNCQIRYNAARSNIQPPNIVVTTSGC